MLVEFVVPKGTEILGRVVDECVQRIIRRWGGCTLTDNQTGYWTNPDTGLLDAEPVCTLSVDVGMTKTGEIIGWFDALAQYVREVGEQHTVYYRYMMASGRFIGPETITQPEGR